MSDTPLPLILVVDDTASARFIRSQTLRRAGFKVIEAGSGHEALQMAASESPDHLARELNWSDGRLHEVIDRATRLGLVALTDGRVALTEAGQHAAANHHLAIARDAAVAPAAPGPQATAIAD